MTTGPKRQLAAAIAFLALLLGACGGDGGDGGTQTDGQPTVTTSGATGTTSTPSATGSSSEPNESPTATGSEGDLAGTWSGTWANTIPDDGSTGTFEIQWEQEGPVLAGTITITGTPCLTGGSISGALNGDAISFGVVEGQVQVAYTGTVSGDSMSGDYSTSCGNAVGTWEATKTA